LYPFLNGRKAVFAFRSLSVSGSVADDEMAGETVYDKG